MADSSFVQSQLAKLGPNFGLELRGNAAWIKCQWHNNGKESTPSLAFNLVKKVTAKGGFPIGSAICHGCGKFFKSWDAFAAELGAVDAAPDSDDFELSITDEVKAALFGEQESAITNLANTLPWLEREDWRGVKGKLMKAAGARLMFSESTDAKFQGRCQAYLPVFVNQEHVGGIKANLEKQGKRNYFNDAGSWVKDVGLYPYDFTKRMLRRRKLSTLMLVEGPRDALKSLQYGIPALGVLGSNNWSESKAELVMALGVRRIITGFDPDGAGEKVTAAVNASLGEEIWVKKYTFPEDMDPGSMTSEHIRKIKKHIL